MFLFLNVFFILKLHAHTEWHIVNSIDNVLYCQFVCCWFCSFWVFLWICFVFFSPHATTVLWNRERKFSVCFHCLEQEKKNQLFSLGVFCIRELWPLWSSFFLILATEIILAVPHFEGSLFFIYFKFVEHIL